MAGHEGRVLHERVPPDRQGISRFHCILWPALLLAAGVPLPRQVYVHGFIYARGERLSKSLGNLVDRSS